MCGFLVAEFKIHEVKSGYIKKKRNRKTSKIMVVDLTLFSHDW